MKKNFLINFLFIICFSIFSWANPSNIEEKLLIIIIVCLFIITLYVYAAILKKKNLGNIIYKNNVIILLIILCFISSIYSIDRGLTIKQSFCMLLLTYMAISLSILYDSKNFLELYSEYIIITIICSLMILVLNFNMANTYANGEWLGFRGIYGFKNILARNMLLGIIVFDFCIKEYKKKNYKKYKYICYIFIFFSQSKTIWVLAVFYIMYKYYIIKGKYKVPILITTIYTISFFILTCFNEYIINTKFADMFYEFTGKTLAFTGRIDIWQFAISAWKTKPIIGYGYGAFWDNENFIYQMTLNLNKWIPVRGSHNGYIDILLNIGILGLILIMIILIKLLLNGVKSENSKIIIPIFLYIIMVNFFENNLFSNNLFWLMIVYYFNTTYLKNKKIRKIRKDT